MNCTRFFLLAAEQKTPSPCPSSAPTNGLANILSSFTAVSALVYSRAFKKLTPSRHHTTYETIASLLEATTDDRQPCKAACRSHEISYIYRGAVEQYRYTM